MKFLHSPVGLGQAVSAAKHRLNSALEIPNGVSHVLEAICAVGDKLRNLMITGF